MTTLAFWPHDLLRVRSGSDDCHFHKDAASALKYIERDRLVVVRRAACDASRVAIGVRGDTREERFAGWTSAEAVLARITPSDLLPIVPTRTTPAFTALAKLQARWRDAPFDWGPAGSVAFELASGRATVHDGSDLDIVLRPSRRIGPREASQLLRETGDLPCALDVQVETGAGAFSLAEFARDAGRVLLRTHDGPRLVLDPWSFGDAL